MQRAFWVWLHRWAGLAMAAFLIVVGLTGSLLAFYPELNRLFNPRAYQITEGAPLALSELAVKAQQQLPKAQIEGVFLGREGMATLISVSSQPDQLDLGFNQLLLDPVTGNKVMRFTWGAISEGWHNLMPFIYKLHYNLALGNFGMWVLGICALIWTLDCFIGFYLTLPQRRRRSSPSAILLADGRGGRWWQRWWPAGKIRWRAGGYKLNFDLHRASGLWLWIILFIFAWSSVYMNLWDTVYTWTTRAVFEYKTPWTELPKLGKPLVEPELDWREAEAIGQQWAQEQAAQQDFRVAFSVGISLDRERGVYHYTVRSSRDIQDQRGNTQIIFDANTGELRLLLLPSGQYAGNTVTSWLYALHVANVFGLPWRIFVCVLGLIIVALSVTGIIIWMKKRRVRLLQRDIAIAPAT